MRAVYLENRRREPIRVLHVEVGGSYGGSLRALEVYLRHSDRAKFSNDLLFYYPTPGSDSLREVVRDMSFLVDSPISPEAKGASRRAFEWGNRRIPSGPKRALGRLRRWLELLRALPLIHRLYGLLKTRRYDLVHANNTFTYQAATLVAARFAGVPVVTHVRNPFPDGILPAGLLRRVGAVATVSRAYEEQLKSKAKGPIVRTCYDCVEPIDGGDPAGIAELRRRFLHEGQEVLVGSAGRLDEQKAYDVLVRAAKRVLQVRPDVAFVVAGEGPRRAELERLIAVLGLEGKVHLLGFRADRSTFLNSLDLFVSSSRWEGLPLAILEAMMLGKPVVATDVGGNREIVIPDKTGELVPASDDQRLADGILSVLNRLESFDAEYARRIATELGDPGANARALDRLLEEVVLETRV